MINAYLKFQASEVVAQIIPVHDHVKLHMDYIKEPDTILNQFELRWFFRPLQTYLIDLKELFQLCEYAFKTDGFIYLSTESARRLEGLTIENFDKEFKRYCEVLVQRWKDRKKYTEEIRCAAEQKLADNAVTLSFFLVFYFLIWLFS